MGSGYTKALFTKTFAPPHPFTHSSSCETLSMPTIFLGVPFNIASYALLTMIIAQVIGNKPGDFVHTFGDVHIYDNHINQVKEQLTRQPKPFPKLTIDPSVKEIDDFKPEHAILENYDPHPIIKADLTAAGGLATKNWKDFVRKSK